MSKFALIEVEDLAGTARKIYKLEVDGVCLYDKFEEEVERNININKNLLRFIAQLDKLSCGERLPNPKQFRIFDNKKGVTVGEIKTGNLRTYFTIQKGYIILFGGYKDKKQKRDIKKAIELAKLFKDYDQKGKGT